MELGKAPGKMENGSEKAKNKGFGRRSLRDLCIPVTMEKNVVTNLMDWDVAKLVVVGKDVHLNTQLCVLTRNASI